MSLGLAAALLTVGALADAFGRRRVLVVSTGLLALTSALGAVAPSMGVLIAARILQGAAGAGVLAASLGAIGHAFHTGHRRTFAASVWGSSVGAGIAIGPLAAGAIAAWLGWRSSFWLAAVAAATLVVAAAGIEESRASTRRSLDLLGAVALALAMAGLTAGLIEGRQSWSSPQAIAPLVGRLGVARRVRRRSRCANASRSSNSSGSRTHCSSRRSPARYSPASP